MRVLMLACAVSVVAVGRAHAAGPTPPAITEERNAAVGFALTADLVTNSLATNCAKIGGELTTPAQQARSGWKKRNWHLVDSAHRYLLFVRAMVARQSGEEAGKKFYDEQRADFVAQAQGALKDNFPSGSANPEGCKKVVAAIANGMMDFENKPEFFNALQDINRDMATLSGK